MLIGLSTEDRDVLEKYVAGCRRLATYSAIAHGSGFKMQSFDGNWTVTPNFPDDELLVAAAARFRQLNNQGEPTAFTTASDLIIKAAKTVDPDLTKVVAQWRKARSSLLNRAIATVICDAVMPQGPRPDDCVSFGNLRPEDLFNTYFYGDFLHVGDSSGKLLNIQSEEGNAAYHMFGFLISMSALAHLYFGFAVLVEHASERLPLPVRTDYENEYRRVKEVRYYVGAGPLRTLDPGLGAVAGRPRRRQAARTGTITSAAYLEMWRWLAAASFLIPAILG